MPDVEVPLQLSDVQREDALDLLVEVFQDEMLTMAVLGGDKSLVRGLMAAGLSVTEQCGEVHLISVDPDKKKELDGLALWLPPGKEFVPSEESGWFDVLKKVAPEIREWWGPLFRAQEDQCKELLGKTAQLDSWYLYQICIRPSFQRRGFGSQLMKFVIEKAVDSSNNVILNTPTIERTKFYTANRLKIMGCIHVQSPQGPAWDQYLVARNTGSSKRTSRASGIKSANK